MYREPMLYQKLLDTKFQKGNFTRSDELIKFKTNND